MNFLKIAVLILFFLSTFIVVKIRPEIHQPMLIEDADFKLTRISDTVKPQEIAVKPQKSAVPDVKDNNKPVEIKITEQPKITSNKNINTQTKKPDQTQLEMLQRIIANAEKEIQAEKPNKTEAIKQTETIKQAPKQQEIKFTEEKPKTIEKEIKLTDTQKSTPKTEWKNPYMTEQEEIIAWNKWRSNIQNQIMRDSDIDYAPLGTVFLFTFVVDKFGNVSNIKVECSNPNFMNIARNNVKPAISKLQRKPILNFPKGTQRTSTIVTGLFLIGTQERFSTPADYSDYERVTY